MKIVVLGFGHMGSWIARELLSEILFNPHSLPQVERVTNKLEFLKHIIQARDVEEARRFFHKLRENLTLRGQEGEKREEGATFLGPASGT